MPALLADSKALHRMLILQFVMYAGGKMIRVKQPIHDPVCDQIMEHR